MFTLKTLFSGRAGKNTSEAGRMNVGLLWGCYHNPRKRWWRLGTGGGAQWRELSNIVEVKWTGFGDESGHLGERKVVPRCLLGVQLVRPADNGAVTEIKNIRGEHGLSFGHVDRVWLRTGLWVPSITQAGGPLGQEAEGLVSSFLPMQEAPV